MNYEKKYKNALNIARYYYSKGYMMINMALEKIFPELKESEDEKIRKELIEHIKANCETNCLLFQKVSPNEIIAWLEKQGEEPKKVSIWKHWKDGIAGSGDGEQIYLVKVGNTYSLSSCLGCECDYIELSELDSLLLENQDEKRSIETTWKPSEEQIKILDEILNFAANHESLYWNDYIFGTLNNLIRQLKKLKA